MKEVINVLIDYKISFEYENKGLEGEFLTAHEIDLFISVCDGVIYFENDGDFDEFKQSKENFDILSNKVGKLIMREKPYLRD